MCKFACRLARTFGLGCLASAILFSVAIWILSYHVEIVVVVVSYL